MPELIVPPNQEGGDDTEVSTSHITGSFQNVWENENNASLGSNYFNFPEIPVVTEPIVAQPMVLSSKQELSQITSNTTNKQIEDSDVGTQLVNRGNFGPMDSAISISYEQMMGPLQYNGILAHNISQNGFQIQRSNSVFSDHITLCENILRQQWMKSGVVNGNHEK